VPKLPAFRSDKALNNSVYTSDVPPYKDEIAEAIKTSLIKGEKVALVGFGDSYVGKRSARSSRKPGTGGTAFKVNTTKVPVFRSDKALKNIVDASDVLPYKVIKVFFGTDRKLIPDAKIPRDFFKKDRGQSINYGTCEVSIPRNHVTGNLETPFMLRKYFEKPEKHIVLMRIDLCKQSQFMDDLRLAATTGKSNEALIFVHGFNNTFEDAARRTAQIAHDIQFSGVPMFYSWPSEGNLSKDAYIRDGNDANQAISYLKLFLKDIVENANFSSVTLLAHSMGNHTLTQAFMALMSEIGAAKLQVFKEIILAAPDIDADTFRDLIAPALISSKSKVTLYASSTDEALIASKEVNGAPRAGDSGTGLVVIKGMETIDATNVDTNLFWGLRHNYVADERNVLSDLHYLIEKSLRASFRHGLDPIPNTVDPQYWKFRK